jgi:signal transduction histidine kinase
VQHRALEAAQLQYAPDALILVVCDDGQGMPPTASQRSGGRGLRDTRDLVAQHRGTLRIVSEPGAGTPDARDLSAR